MKPRTRFALCLALACVSCKAGTMHLDGSTVDAASYDIASLDSAVTDAASHAPISVTLLRGTVPILGAAVVSHDATGAVVGTYATSSAGTVSVPSAGVELITVVDADASQLYTAVGVKPGDALVLPTFANVTTLGTLSVTLPAAPMGAVGFQVFIGTDTGSAMVTSAPISVAVSSADVGDDGNLNVLAMARDANYNIIAVSTATVTPPAMGVTTPVATGAWSMGFDQFQLMVANGTIGDLENTTSGQTIDGVHFDLPTRTGNMPYMWWNPVPSLGGYVDYSSQFAFGSTSTGKRFYARRLAAAATSDTIDENVLLPGLTGTAAQTSNIARPTLTWTPSAPEDSADGVILNTRYDGAQWAFMLPPTQTSVQFPALPASLASWVPTSAVANPYAVVIDTSYDANYDAFRSDGFGMVSGPAFLHPGTGTLNASIYFPAF